MNSSSSCCPFTSHLPMNQSMNKCCNHLDNLYQSDHCPLRDCPMFMKSNCPLKCMFESHPLSGCHTSCSTHMQSNDMWKHMLGMYSHHGSQSGLDHCPLRDCPAFWKSDCPLKCYFMQHGGTHDCHISCPQGNCGHSGKCMLGGCSMNPHGCGSKCPMIMHSNDGCNMKMQENDCCKMQGNDCCNMSRGNSCTMPKTHCCIMPKTHCCTMQNTSRCCMGRSETCNMRGIDCCSMRKSGTCDISKTECCHPSTGHGQMDMSCCDTSKSGSCIITKSCKKGKCNVKIQAGVHRFNLKCPSEECQILEKCKKGYSHVKIKCPNCVLNVKCPYPGQCKIIDCDRKEASRSKEKTEKTKKQKKHGAHHGDHHGKHHPHCSNREEHHPKCSGKIEEMEKSNESCCAKTIEKECPKTMKECCTLKETQQPECTKKDEITPKKQLLLEKVSNNSQGDR